MSGGIGSAKPCKFAVEKIGDYTVRLAANGPHPYSSGLR